MEQLPLFHVRRAITLTFSIFLAKYVVYVYDEYFSKPVESLDWLEEADLGTSACAFVFDKRADAEALYEVLKNNG